jgi:hypothetical protein
MRRSWWARRIGLGLALALAAASGQAGWPFPSFQIGSPDNRNGGSWQFPPMRQKAPGIQVPTGPTNRYNYNYSYRGGPPPRGGQRGGSYGQPPAQHQSSQPPRLEETLSGYQPYAQESVIYRIRIVSGENLKTVDVVLPSSNAVVFKRLEGPVARMRTTGGRQEIVNEFHYALTPLRAGSITLSPVRVRGTLASGYGPSRSREFEISGDSNLQLQVKPMVPGVQPWLPLQHLALRTEVLGAEELGPGKPFTLLVEMFAVGTTGSQLPSLERQLQGPDFKVYREQTNTTEELTSDRRGLQGTRKEYFTLVPQHAGELHLPELRTAWWDVNAETLQYASVPTQPLGSGGGLFAAARFGLSEGTFFPAGSSSVFWVPVAGIFGLLIGYWLAIWARGKKGEEPEPTPLAPLLMRLQVWGGLLWRRLAPALGRFREPTAAAVNSLAPAAGELGHQLATAARKLSPAPYWRRFREMLVMALPRSLRFWFCVRSAAAEEDPGAWVRYVKTVGNPHLGLSPQAPLSKVAERIIEVQINADPSRVQTLLEQLDSALYGGEHMDFAQWKRELAREVRPRPSLRRRPRVRRPGGLPRLNPIRA